MDKEKVCHEITMLLLQKKISSGQNIALDGTTVKTAASMYFEIYSHVAHDFDEAHAKFFGDLPPSTR